jgi:hypothetical protein
MTLDRLSPSQMRILFVIALLLLTVIGGLGIALRGGSFDRPSVVYDNVPVAGVAPRAEEPEAEEPDDFDLIFVDPDVTGTSLFSMANRGKSDLEWQMVGVSRHPAGRVGMVRVGIVGPNSFTLQSLLQGDPVLADRFRFVDLGDQWFESVLAPYDMILVTEAGDGISVIEAEALYAFAATGRSVVMGIAGFSLLPRAVTIVSALFGVDQAVVTPPELRTEGKALDLHVLAQHEVTADVANPEAPDGALVSFTGSAAQPVVGVAGDTPERGYVLARDGEGRFVLLGGNLAAWYVATPDLVRNAIRWAGVTWLFVEPSGGTIRAGTTSPIRADINVSSFLSGTHEARLFIGSNDPAQPRMVVPLSLQVMGEALARIDLEELDFETVYVGYPAQQTLRIENEGSTDLMVSAVEVDHPHFRVDPSAFSVPVFGSRTISVTYSPRLIETVATTLTIYSNDAVSPTLQLPIVAESMESPVIALMETASTNTVSIANVVVKIGPPIMIDPSINLVTAAGAQGNEDTGVEEAGNETPTPQPTHTPTATPSPTATVTPTVVAREKED